MSIKDNAKKFINRIPFRYKTSYGTFTSYFLHGNEIAKWEDENTLILSFCGWYTMTTSNHLNKISEAANLGLRFSPSMYKTNCQDEIIYDRDNLTVILKGKDR